MPVSLTVMTLPPFGSDFPLSHTSLLSNHNIIIISNIPSGNAARDVEYRL